MEGNQTATSLALAGRCPDFRFIREKVPIADVARDLGVEVKSDNYRAHCWRPENHRHGDRDPSVRFQKKNRNRCFMCNKHTWLNNDLVMMVLAFDATLVVDRTARGFPVSEVSNGKQMTDVLRLYRVGVAGSPLELLVGYRSWAESSPAVAPAPAQRFVNMPRAFKLMAKRGGL